MYTYKCRDDDYIIKDKDNYYTVADVCELLEEKDSIILKQKKRIEKLEFLLSSHTIFKVVE